MRTLTCVEMACVSGGASGSGAINDMGGDVIFTLGAAGLLVSIPVIVGGAILGVPTLGLGFIAMTGGIVATAISGAFMIQGIVQSAKGSSTTTVVTP